VYESTNNVTIFITIDVKKKLLNGLIMNRTMKNIDKAENVHTFLVVSVNVVKLKCSFEFIYIINYIKFIYNIILMNNEAIINKNVIV
jgi:hypothetical protein